MISEAEPRAEPRNIIIFADGTGQDGGIKENSNIYKLFSMAEDRTRRQICYYHAGVGTSRTMRVLGLATGWGFGTSVRECYGFLHEEYRAGDRIFLIGFSRGAAVVRSLAFFIHMFGILPRSRHELVERAWKIYTIRDAAQRKQKAKAFLERNPTMWSTVHFLGCYDTVAALGAPYQWASKVIDHLPGCKHRFHDMRLSPSVEHAYHALALDDERLTFHPLLWDPIEDERPQAASDGVDQLQCKVLRQVWFLGMHSDVGGGYPEANLSDIPLEWMLNRAADHGFQVYEPNRLQLTKDPDGRMHDSRTGKWRIYRKKMRGWNKQRSDKPVIHESVKQRTKNRMNSEGPYQTWIDEYQPEVEPFH